MFATLKLLDARLLYTFYVSINNLLFTIVMSVIPRFTYSDYPFGIFKLFKRMTLFRVSEFSI